MLGLSSQVEANPDEQVSRCAYRPTTFGPAGVTQDWLKLGEPGYPADNSWQNWRCVAECRVLTLGFCTSSTLLFFSTQNMPCAVAPACMALPIPPRNNEREKHSD
eukprot:1081378-Rhodomonas_salina.2